MHKKIVTVFASNKFFYGCLGFFVLEAAWIALTARYPQAFDEQFHLGIIQQYSHQWSPFFSRQPSGADRLGPLIANPSFLYQYLLSFPYRLLAYTVNNMTAQVIALRCINIGLFAWGLWVFRRLLLQSPASKALVHVTLLFFILIPVVPLLASQINYDNLFIPVVGLSLLWTMRLVETWRARKVLSFEQVLRLSILCLFASIIKYPFLPIFAVLGLVILLVAWHARSSLVDSWQKQLRVLSKVRLGVYMAFLLGASMLWLGSYGLNVVRYHTLLPSCEKVLSVQRCLAYSPWARDYNFAHNGMPKPNVTSILAYTEAWIDQSLTELVFTISSRFADDGITVSYYVSPPLPAVGLLAKVVLWSGAILTLWFSRRLLRIRLIQISAAVLVLYVGSLWLRNFQDYLRTGYPVAVHGRYLLPLLPLVLLAIALCYSWTFRSRPLRKILPHYSGRVGLVAIALFLLLQGGGIVTYIVRSNVDWFWDQDVAAPEVNRAAQAVLKLFIIGD